MLDRVIVGIYIGAITHFYLLQVVTTRMIRPRMDSNVAQAVLALYPKYSRDEVKNALIDNIKV